MSLASRRLHSLRSDAIAVTGGKRRTPYAEFGAGWSTYELKVRLSAEGRTRRGEQAVPSSLNLEIRGQCQLHADDP